jgi:hypothetical protein
MNIANPTIKAELTNEMGRARQLLRSINIIKTACAPFTSFRIAVADASTNIASYDAQNMTEALLTECVTFCKVLQLIQANKKADANAIIAANPEIKREMDDSLGDYTPHGKIELTVYVQMTLQGGAQTIYD